jgi:hypothetical protein
MNVLQLEKQQNMLAIVAAHDLIVSSKYHYHQDHPSSSSRPYEKP